MYGGGARRTIIAVPSLRRRGVGGGQPTPRPLSSLRATFEHAARGRDFGVVAADGDADVAFAASTCWWDRIRSSRVRGSRASTQRGTRLRRGGLGGVGSWKRYPLTVAAGGCEVCAASAMIDVPRESWANPFARRQRAVDGRVNPGAVGGRRANFSLMLFVMSKHEFDGVPRRSSFIGRRPGLRSSGGRRRRWQHHLPPIAVANLLSRSSLACGDFGKRMTGGQTRPETGLFTVSRSGCRQCQNGGTRLPKKSRTALTAAAGGRRRRREALRHAWPSSLARLHAHLITLSRTRCSGNWVTCDGIDHLPLSSFCSLTPQIV